MNPIRKAWRKLRQQDRLDKLTDEWFKCKLECQRLQDELDYRQERQSVGSRKGWETRKARSAELMAARQDASMARAMRIHADIVKGEGC
jgi:hypothetical protein